jgi:ABC-2 type transport system permease protein
MTISRAVFLKGTPIALFRDELLALGLFAAILTWLATRAFHKKLS